MKKINSKNILFIHGAFVGKNCWDEWVKYFEEKGYNVTAPAWLYKDAPPAELRKQHPNSKIAELHINDVIEQHTKIINQLDEKPIIIGHSFGGLMTQILLNRDLGAAGIALHPVPPMGVLPLHFSFLKATWGPLGFLSSTGKTFLFTMDQWKYAFANGFSDAEAQRTYDELVVPESKYLARGALTKNARVDFKKAHNPLLIVAGSTDNIIPPGLNRTNYKKYKQNGSVTDFKLFEGNNHSVLGLPNWRTTADYIYNWIKSN